MVWLSQRGVRLSVKSLRARFRALFFLIYVNDMVRACRDLDLVLSADDTNIFAQDRDPAELFGRVNRGLGELSRWFRCKRLTLNLKKTEYVYFRAGQGGG